MTQEDGRTLLDKNRREIDALDARITELLNERGRLAQEIGDVKKRLATEVDAPSREDEVMSNIAQHNRGPLNDEALRRIYERIIGEMKLLQRGRTTENGNF